MTAWLKYILTFAAVFAFRLLPFRAPNVEPILAAAMPLSKRYGALPGVAFGALSIALYDAVTSGWGMWTLTTSVCYGALGGASYLYFKHRAPSRANFVGFSVAGILFYDAVTGPIAGALSGQAFSTVLAGQVPFTVLHLLGGVAFATLVSPALYRWYSLGESRASVPSMQSAGH